MQGKSALICVPPLRFWLSGLACQPGCWEALSLVAGEQEAAAKAAGCQLQGL